MSKLFIFIYKYRDSADIYINHCMGENIKECIARKIRSGLFLGTSVSNIIHSNLDLYNRVFGSNDFFIQNFETELQNNLKEGIETPLIFSKYQKEWDLFLDSLIPHIRMATRHFNLEFFYVYEMEGEMKNYVVHDIINPNEDNTKLRRMFRIYSD